MARLKDAKSPFSPKSTCMGQLKHAFFFVTTPGVPLARIWWSFGDNPTALFAHTISVCDFKSLSSSGVSSAMLSEPRGL